MIAATMFSGIGAPECAMPDWQWAWCAEIEKFPSAVLRARHPESVNLGDINAEDFVTRAKGIGGRPDVIVFGSPCQDFSVAGRRVGLDGDRGNLALVALGIVNQLRPRWVVFENVPGLLSSRSGSAEAERAVREGGIGARADSDEDSDFAAFLSLVQQCGYLGCYRITDAQYAGVPQRRRRIFAVFHLGDWRPAAAVLFEPEGLRGDHPPSRETGESVAPTISSRPTGGGGLGTDFDLDGGLISKALSASRGKACANAADLETYIPVAGTLDAVGGKSRGAGTPPGMLVADGPVGAVSSKWSKGTGGPAGDECYNLVAAPLAFDCKAGGNTSFAVGEQSGSLRGEGHGGGHQAIAFQTRVARNGRGDASELVPALNGADAGATSDMRPCVAVFKPSHFTRGKDGAPSGVSPPLGAEPDKGDQDPVLFIGDDYADAEEADTTEILRSLRCEVGEKAFEEWAVAIATSLQASEILRPEVHGRSFRRQTIEAGCRMDDGALPRSKAGSEGAVPEVREAERERCSPWGWGLSEQLTEKFNQAMSKLSHEGAPTEAFLRSLRRSGQGIRLLQQALHPVQGGYATAVRRLTPVECERLQAFPDNYSNIIYRGKPAADGPRYKALGNAMNVNEVRWVLQRIQTFEEEKAKW